MTGVLALQGGFAEHTEALRKLGEDSFEIRQKSDLENRKIDRLIFPGGESTTISKLLFELGLFDPLKEMIDGNMPVFGTCAGMILLAKKIVNEQTSYFGAIDISVYRNAFGRQLGSFSYIGDFGDIGKFPMRFIRAPFIESAAPGVIILAFAKKRMVAARQKNILVTAFHPELTGDLRIHEYFLKNF